MLRGGAAAGDRRRRPAGNLSGRRSHEPTLRQAAKNKKTSKKEEIRGRHLNSAANFLVFLTAEYHSLPG